MPKLVRILAINLLVLLCLVVLAETSVRILKAIFKEDNTAIAYDEDLGWSLRDDIVAFDKLNHCGEAVHTEPPLSKYLKFHSSKPDPKFRLLIIGDSFTHAHEVTHGAAYFNVFSDLNEDIDVYVAGVGGFGTAQQRLLLDKVFDDIKPDFIVWQLSSNDIANNIYELDNSSFYNNQRPRMYFDLETGGYFMKNPGFWLYDISSAYRSVFWRLFIIDRKYDLGLLDFFNSLIALDKDESRSARRDGLRILKHLIQDARETYGVPIFAFSVGLNHDEEFRQAFEDSEIIYFAKFAEDPRFVPGTTDCYPLDNHWNRLGNAVAGQKLTELLRAHISQ